MPGGFGATVLDMIIRIRENRKLLKRKSRLDKGYFRNREFYEAQFKKRDLNYKKATREQLEQIRWELKMERLHKRRVRIVTMGLAVLVAIPLAWFVLFRVMPFLIHYDTPTTTWQEMENEQRRARIQKQEKLYQHCLRDGKKWLKKKHFHNATYQFRKAVEIHPERFLPQYRLGEALVYQCHFDDKNCTESDSQVQFLTEQYDSRFEVYKLRARYFRYQDDSVLFKKNEEIADSLQAGIKP